MWLKFKMFGFSAFWWQKYKDTKYQVAEISDWYRLTRTNPVWLICVNDNIILVITQFNCGILQPGFLEILHNAAETFMCLDCGNYRNSSHAFSSFLRLKLSPATFGEQFMSWIYTATSVSQCEALSHAKDVFSHCALKVEGGQGRNAQNMRNHHNW